VQSKVSLANTLHSLHFTFLIRLVLPVANMDVSSKLGTTIENGLNFVYAAAIIASLATLFYGIQFIGWHILRDSRAMKSLHGDSESEPLPADKIITVLTCIRDVIQVLSTLDSINKSQHWWLDFTLLAAQPYLLILVVEAGALSICAVAYGVLCGVPKCVSYFQESIGQSRQRRGYGAEDT
jgi:hypothetical protein